MVDKKQQIEVLRVDEGVCGSGLTLFFDVDGANAVITFCRHVEGFFPLLFKNKVFAL